MADTSKPSLEGLNPVVQVFDLPPTDVSMLEYRMSPVKTVTSGIHPLEVIMPATNAFIDLGRSYFEVELQLKKANGTNIADGENLFPGQNLMHTMIKQCSITFNGTLISAQSDTYAYRAFFETLLNNDC